MDLKPCPFCGFDLISYDVTSSNKNLVCCKKCSASIDNQRQWNTRTSGWISIDDALPETEQICDVWLSCSDGSKGRLSNVIWNGKDWIDAFFNRTKIHEEQWITHWIAAPSEPEVK